MRTFMRAVTGIVFSVAACSSGGTSVVAVENSSPKVASVVVSVPLSLVAGQTARATATPKDANGTALTGRPILWYTSTASVASVTDSGVISAVAPGTTVLSAVSEGVSGQATMSVTPPPPTPIANLSVSLNPSTVTVGGTAQATATLQDSSGNTLAGQTITWESSDPTVATVDATGKVRGVKHGNSVIKATGGGKTNGSALTVNDPAPIPVASVIVSPPNPIVQVGGTVQLSAVTRDANGNVLTGRIIDWSSSNTSIVTVSTSGLVTAVSAGSASVTAASEGQTGSSTITVSAPAPVPVASVAVSPTTASLTVGGTQQLSATTRDANNNILTGRVIGWSSSNTNVATVSSSGLVTAVAAGTASVTATSEGKTGSSAITVSAPAPVPVASVSISPTTANLTVGGTQQLSATTRDASSNILTGRVIAWSSSNTSIATVSGSGLVTAVAAGTVSVTATSEGKSGSSTITVSAPAPAPVASVSVSPATATITVGATQQLSATTRDASGNVLTGRVVTWSSANSSIASVNSNTGLVTAVAAGTIQVTATSETKTGTSTITVQVPPAPPPPGSSNEPAGMTFINQRSFSSLQESPWYTNSNLSIVQDATAPKSPSGVIRATFPAGYAGGTSPGPAELSFNSYKTLYVSYYAKYSSNWQGHLTGINKHAYAWVNGTTSSFVMEAEGYGSGPLSPRPILQSMVVGNGPYPPNLVPNATITRNTWFHIEIVIVGNSSGNADGSMDIYLDGVHVTRATGLQWSNGAALFNIFQFYPIWGGISDTVNSDMWFEWDDVYVSGKN